MLNRRNFMQLSLTSVVLLLSGTPLSESDLWKFEKIVHSFPKVQLVPSTNPLHLAFFIHTGQMEEGHMGIHIANAVVDCTKAYDLRNILREDITELEFDRPRPNVSAIVSGSNRIARQTRRGRGNHYAVLSDHILVWYKGINLYDTPIQRVGVNLAYGPNYTDYFVKVKGVDLTADDHNKLKSLGYQRVI